MTNKKAIAIIKDELKHCQIHLRDKNKAPEYYQEMNELCEAYEMAIKALENPRWIPVKTRMLDAKLDADVLKKLKDRYGDFDDDEAWCICCPLPKDAQEVLITTKYGDVVLTEFCVDDDGCWFDGYEDRGDVLAWMPLPEPYTKEETT